VEIGVVMGIAEGTVRTRIMRARQILRQKLAAMRRAYHDRRRSGRIDRRWDPCLYGAGTAVRAGGAYPASGSRC